MRTVESPEPLARRSTLGFHSHANTSEVCPMRFVTSFSGGKESASTVLGRIRRTSDNFYFGFFACCFLLDSRLFLFGLFCLYTFCGGRLSVSCIGLKFVSLEGANEVLLTQPSSPSLALQPRFSRVHSPWRPVPSSRRLLVVHCDKEVR